MATKCNNRRYRSLANDNDNIAQSLVDRADGLVFEMSQIANELQGLIGSMSFVLHRKPRGTVRKRYMVDLIDEHDNEMSRIEAEVPFLTSPRAFGSIKKSVKHGTVNITDELEIETGRMEAEVRGLFDPPSHTSMRKSSGPSETRGLIDRADELEQQTNIMAKEVVELIESSTFDAERESEGSFGAAAVIDAPDVVSMNKYDKPLRVAGVSEEREQD